MTATKKEAEVTPERKILVQQGSKKAFIITVPQDAKTTFGPWVPPGMRSDRYGSPGDPMGTLRVYGRTEKHVIGVFSGVTGFRDLSLDYVEIDPAVFSDGFTDEEEDSEEEIPFDSTIKMLKMHKDKLVEIYS